MKKYFMAKPIMKKIILIKINMNGIIKMKMV
jgi:hypothetical protein